MSKKRSVKYLVLFTAIIILLMPWLFPRLLLLVYMVLGSDYRVCLPMDYELVRVYAGAVGLQDLRKDEVVIMPNIDGYRVFDKVIAGHVSATGLPLDDAIYSKPGYFIVDMRNRKVRQSLSKSEWLIALEHMNIKGEPRLHKPTRLDRLLGS